MGDLSNKLIRQTFDSLIKTSDEDPIGVTPKRLQDGVGNDLPVEVSLSGMVYYGTQDFTNAFEKADVLVSPTCPTTAFKIGEKANDPLAMYLNDIATIPVNMAGIGGMSLPSGLADEDGLPVGFQIMSPVMKDERMYSVGAALEAALLSKWGAPLLDKAPIMGGAR